MKYKLGSLFDGSGGFPLAGSLCGIEPVWASEVEPYPIAVTRSRFPNMKHLGDISKINGGEIEPVDIITFGSPCQDLSVAGKRAGLKHEANGDEETTRSGLFMEAVRIIKEMRKATNGTYPRFALWENVPGAFSSNKGEESPVYCLQGNGIDRADTAGCNGKGWKEDTSYTLNTIDRPAVVYKETYQKTTGPLMANSHPGSYSGQDAYNDMFVVGKEDVAGVDCRNLTEHEELYPTLQAKPNGGQSLNYSGAVRVRYIVRRLTPTECARLQGFPDKWGHPDAKEDFTDEDYRFWLEVRNTHATVIGGKEAKEYTKAQMLTWYNKLHTDSAEYKMWGNGIALPPALYLLQGMADVLNRKQQESTEKIL